MPSLPLVRQTTSTTTQHPLSQTKLNTFPIVCFSLLLNLDTVCSSLCWTLLLRFVQAMASSLPVHSATCLATCVWSGTFCSWTYNCFIVPAGVFQPRPSCITVVVLFTDPPPFSLFAKYRNRVLVRILPSLLFHILSSFYGSHHNGCPPTRPMVAARGSVACQPGRPQWTPQLGTHFTRDRIPVTKAMQRALSPESQALIEPRPNHQRRGRTDREDGGRDGQEMGRDCSTVKRPQRQRRQELVEWRPEPQEAKPRAS